ITTHFPENQKNSNIFLIALSVTPYGVPALPKGEPSRLCCKLNNNFPSFQTKKHIHRELWWMCFYFTDLLRGREG
ncbi:MAG: hypothetical protein IJ351_02215, partial [Oscillospiraceae bacterium]|nr:hypothetical protein [Oscillospiraceae bacterium]